MKHYIEVVSVEPKGKVLLYTLDDVLTHDLDILSYLKPKERPLWIESHSKLIIIEGADIETDERKDWLLKPYGVYIRVVDTHE